MHTETALGCETLRALLGSVVHHNAGKWLRFILTILKNEADAEDVLQEAVRRVLARNVSLESEDQVRMYLNRAIANAALELYNCRKESACVSNPSTTGFPWRATDPGRVFPWMTWRNRGKKNAFWDFSMKG